MESLDDTDTLATAGWGVTATLIEPDVPRSTTDAAPPDDGMSGNARSSTSRSNAVSSTSSVIVVGILAALLQLTRPRTATYCTAGMLHTNPGPPATSVAPRMLSVERGCRAGRMHSATCTDFPGHAVGVVNRTILDMIICGRRTGPAPPCDCCKRCCKAAASNNQAGTVSFTVRM